jgi:hypothetical protein
MANEWPVGIISHTAGTAEQGWCLVDVWGSQERFDAFMGSRLGPAMGRAGLPEPQVTPFEVYNRFGLPSAVVDPGRRRSLLTCHDVARPMRSWVS